jgi:hypothetical protein
MRRRTLLVALAGLAVMGAVGVVPLWPRQQTDRVTLYCFELVRHGMNRSEVEKILGAPGDYRTGPTEPSDFGGGKGRGSSDPVEATAVSFRWEGDTVDLSVDFGASGNVTGAFFEGRVRTDHGLIGNLLWRAKRQWQRWFP